MARPGDAEFKRVDDALAEYYKRLNVANYRDENGAGLFLKCIKNEALDDADLSLEQELGDTCNPYDCAYLWMNNDTFPIPSYAQIPCHERKTFIFYVVQYCYKHSQPPSDQYIQQILVTKCKGTVIATLMPQKNNTEMIFERVMNSNGEYIEEQSAQIPGTYVWIPTPNQKENIQRNDVYQKVNNNQLNASKKQSQPYVDGTKSVDDTVNESQRMNQQMHIEIQNEWLEKEIIGIYWAQIESMATEIAKLRRILATLQRK